MLSFLRTISANKESVRLQLLPSTTRQRTGTFPLALQHLKVTWHGDICFDTWFGRAYMHFIAQHASANAATVTAVCK